MQIPGLFLWIDPSETKPKPGGCSSLWNRFYDRDGIIYFAAGIEPTSTQSVVSTWSNN